MQLLIQSTGILTTRLLSFSHVLGYFNGIWQSCGAGWTELCRLVASPSGLHASLSLIIEITQLSCFHLNGTQNLCFHH